MNLKMSYAKKNRMLVGVVVLGFFLCWHFAFSKTFEARKIHHELSQRASSSSDLSFNRDYMEKKLLAMEGILAGYEVEEAAWSNELWLNGSAGSAKKEVSIDYTLEKLSAEPDTNSTGITQSLYCYGKFSDLISVMDGLEKTVGIGKISAIQIKGPKEDSRRVGKAECTLRMDFKAIDLKRDMK